jgi:DNA topoisomerase-2
MILVNGANGIGTGYSTNLPPFNITDIIHNIKVLLYNDSKSYKEVDGDNDDDNENINESKLDCADDDIDNKNEYTDFVEMNPYYKGFKGEIEQLSTNKYRTIGVFERTNDTTITVTELPIGIWTQNYKEHLEKLQSDENVKIDKKTGKVKKSKKTKELLSYTNNLGLGLNNKKSKSKKKSKKSKSTEEDLEKINITLKFTKAKLDKHMNNKEKFMTTFKLVEGKSTKTSNMYLFDENNRLKKYNSALDILKHFYNVRIQYYKKRYYHLLNKLKRRKNILREKIRFIKGFINDEIKILKKTDEQILDVMIEHKFMKFDDIEDINQENNDSAIHNLDSYKYLIDMPIRSLTKSKLKELRAQHKERKVEYKSLLKKSPKILWLDDLCSVKKCL